MSKKTEIKWRPSPQKQDYVGAESYLSLQFEPGAAKKIVQNLREADGSEFAAKDIFRASELPLLPDRDSHTRFPLCGSFRYRSRFHTMRPT